MRRSILLLLTVLLVGALGAACAVPMADGEAMECTDALGCVEVAADEAVTIASMNVLSGPVSFLGLDQTGAIEIAIDDFGDLLGHEIALVSEDSQCSAEGGQSAAQKVAANSSVAGALGTACSSAGTAALPIIHEAGLSMISASNTSPTLTEPNPENGGVWQPGYYRTAHNDLFQGRLAGEFAYNQLGARTAATIHDGSPYADSLQQVMADVFTELGGRITYQGAVNVGDTEMLPILTEIATDPPDILFYPIFQPEVNFVTAQIKDVAGLEDTILMSADAAFSSDIMVNTGEAILGLYLTSPLVQGDAYDELLAKWDAKFGGSPPSAFHAHAYDATLMLLQAIESVAQDDGAGNLLIGKQAIRDALSAIESFPGITGTLACGETGDCATGEALAVYQINDMEAWPPELVDSE
ncbi:MAG: branched-chain amino acid ABC transporter substrate-binding protein [Caldilineaceae bacterium]|nr:branched-chain amino acid ABC transporter substrate-binding protein [Caldilineaceae bacterium]